MFFLEHVQERQTGTLTAVLQFVLKRPWWYFTHCRLANDTGSDIKNAGFSEVKLEAFDADELVTPKPVIPVIPYVIKPHVMGVATK